MRNLGVVLATLTACAGGSSSVKEAAAVADLVLVNGTVYTMDPLRPRAEAVAIAGGKVEAVGSAADVRRLAGPRTRVVDLRGRAAVPGLVDAHCHLYGLGKASENLGLRGMDSPEHVAEAVAAVAKQRAAGEWIEGRGWDQNLWTPAEFPRHDLLDTAAPDNPVALRRIDGHALWANQAAMRAAGITRDSKDPPGGKILRDAKGEPTGVFVDNAMDLVESRVPAASPEVIRRRILAAAKLASEAGLVGVHEMGIGDDVIAVYRELAAEGKLPLRVYAFMTGEGAGGAPRLDDLASRRPDAAGGVFAVRGVKFFADGALGSRGADLIDDYSDDPGNDGLVLLAPEQLREALAVATEHGWQVAVHAIGDAANRTVLDAVETLGAAGRDARVRIEHAQVVTTDDMPRFAALGVIASMQPSHATSDMPWAEARLGPERVRGAYAWRALLDAGARMAFGSDFPVEEHSPMVGLHAAVTRQDARGQPEGGWYAGQRLTIDEALRMYTVGAAYAGLADGRQGVIAPGYAADVTVFDRDLVVETLLDSKVDLTIRDGIIVYDRAR